MIMSKAQMVKSITMMFTCYGQGNEAERIAVYTQMLEDLPAELLDKVCRKAILECKYLPSIAEIRTAAQSLMATVDPVRKVKTWQEAQQEISRGMARTWYRGCLGEIPDTDPEYGQPCEPYWSTKEVAQAVNSYGWDNLMLARETDMPTIWAQLRRLYEQACQTKAEVEVNTYVLGNDMELLREAVHKALPGGQR